MCSVILFIYGQTGDIQNIETRIRKSVIRFLLYLEKIACH